MKFMNLKRFASTALAGALTLSMAVPALAASNSTEITGAYEEITLSVVVPSTGKAIINPYGLPYKLNSEVSVSNQPITTAAPLIIQNKSVVALNVTGSVTGAIPSGSNATFVSGTPDDDNTEVQVNFEAFEAPTLTANNVTETDVTYPLFAALDSSDAAITQNVSTSTDDFGTAAAGNGTLVLREGNADGELQAGGAAFFRLSGKASLNDDWTATDTFTTTIAFTFVPGTYSKSAGTIAAITGLQMGATLQANVTFTSALPTGVTAKTTTWISSDPDVLTVAADGTKVTAQSAGNATITVTIEGSDGITYTATSPQITVAAP